MRFDQEFIERVREANNIVDIIGQYTDLKGRGHQHMGICPFPDHAEKTPSFSVSENKQLYHCFGCKKSGNTITFLETFNGFSFVEAIEFLARRAGVPLPVDEKKNKNYSQDKGKRTQMYRVNRFSAVFYFQNLKSLDEKHPARQYLVRRDIPEDVIDEFRLGYAKPDWDKLLKYFYDKKVPTSVAEHLGLLRKNRKGGLFDLFRDRIMFPIFALNDEVVGFGGRIIEQGEPKYINSVESKIFKKGKTFYGLNKTAKHIRAEDQVFVVEGYMDLLSLYARGVKNVVATLGTALTDDHIHILKRWTPNIVLLFDGDQAGQQAAERSLIPFLSQGLSPQIFALPKGQDPDDYIREKGVEVFREQAQKSKDLFLFLLQKWMENYKGLPKEKMQILDRLGPLFAGIKDERLKQIYLEEVALRLDEKATTVVGWLRSPPSRAPEAKPLEKQTAAPARFDRIQLKEASVDEVMALGLSIKSLKLFNYFVKEKGLDYIASEEIKAIFSEIVAKYGQEPESFDKLAHLVVSRVENPEKIVNLISISSPFEQGDEDETMLKDCLYRVKDRYLQRQASILAAQIKDQPSDEKLEQIMNVQKERLALKKQKAHSLGE